MNFVGEKMNLSNQLLGFWAFFLWVVFADTVSHTYISTYTQIIDVGGSECSAVTKVDDKEVFISDCNKLTPKQEWINEPKFEELRTKITANNEKMCQRFQKFIDYEKEQVNQIKGVHVYQRRYGCSFNDKWDEFGYNGEDFIVLETNEQYIPRSPQAKTNWKKIKETAGFLNKPGENDCVYWLNEFLSLEKTNERKDIVPEVTLLQKDPSSPVMCHVTGLPSGEVNISWTKNGREFNNPEKVELGELLQNEDGTFQKSSILKVTPDEWKWCQYRCVVVTDRLWKDLSKPDLITNSNFGNGNKLWIVCGILVLVVLVVLVFLVHYCRKNDSEMEKSPSLLSDVSSSKQRSINDNPPEN